MRQYEIADKTEWRENAKLSYFLRINIYRVGK